MVARRSHEVDRLAILVKQGRIIDTNAEIDRIAERLQEFAIVLATCCRRRECDLALREDATHRCQRIFRQIGIVVDCRTAAADTDVCLRRTCHGDNRIGRAAHACQQLFTHFRLVPADRSAHAHGVRNDVSCRTALNGPNADHTEFLLRFLPADHALQVHHEFGGHHHRVDRGAGARAMAADAVEDNVETAREGVHLSLHDLNRIIGRRRHMQGEAVVRHTEPVENTVRHHLAGTAAPFLGRLGHEHQRALPVFLHLDKRLRRGEEDGHVGIVATGMHHIFGFAIPFGLHRAGIIKPGLFLDWQAVHVRAHHDKRTFAILQDTNHTCLADTFGHFEAKLFQAFRDDPGGAGFMQAEFRIGMEVLVDIDPVIQILIHHFRQVGFEAAVDVRRFRVCGCRKRGQRDQASEACAGQT